MTGGQEVPPKGTAKRPRWWQFALLGLAAGFLSTTLGIGGGVIMVPLLMLWFGLPSAVAVAISVGSIVFSSGIGVGLEFAEAAVGHGKNLIRLDFCAMLLAGSLPGVFVGQKLRAYLPERPMAWAFALILTLAALKLAGAFTIFGAERSAVLDGMLTDSGLSDTDTQYLIIHNAAAVLLGFLGGLSAPLFGLGGGIIFVPGLAILFVGFSEVEAARTTSLGTVFLSTLLTVYLQWRAGAMRFDLLKLILPGSLVGAVLGWAVASHLADDWLCIMISAFIVYCAFRMVRNAYAPKAICVTPS